MLRVTSIILVALVIALVALGSVVHSTGASLSCPDWPLCGGEAFPAMVGGVRFEHSHRVLAAVVALLVVVVAVLAWRQRSLDSHRAGLAIVAVGLVTLQAALGAMTVLLRLPPAVSTAHFATSMLLLLACTGVALRSTPRRPVTDALARFRVVATGIVYAQLVLGALVRHLGAGYACGRDAWGCAPLLSSWPALAAVQLVHRAFAVVVAVTLIALAQRSARAGAPAHAGVLLALLAAQIGLGLATVATGVAIEIVTVHATLGALLLIATATVGALSSRSPSLGTDREQGRAGGALDLPARRAG